MKDVLHKSGIFLLFLYTVSVYILSYVTEYYTISHIVFVMFFGATFFYVALKRELIFPKSFSIYLIFLFMMIISYFWIIRDFTSSTRITSMTLLLILTLTVVNILDSEKNISSAVKLFYFAGIIMCLYSLFFYGYEGTLEMMSEDSVMRMGGEINEENNYGMICAITAVVGLYFAYYENQGIYYFISVIPVLYTLASGSRMALLILITGVFILVILRRGKNILSTIIIWTLTISALIIIFNYVASLDLYIFKRFESFLNIFDQNDYMSQTDTSSLTRLKMMTEGLKWFLEKPVFGFGTDQYAVLYAQHYGMLRYSHSNIIEVLVNHGIVGFFVYYSLYVYIFYHLIRALKNHLPYSVLMFTIMGVMIVANVFFVLIYLKINYIIMCGCRTIFISSFFCINKS